MIDYADDVEVITKNKCVECGDKLAPFETNLCLICEVMADQIQAILIVCPYGRTIFFYPLS